MCAPLRRPAGGAAAVRPSTGDSGRRNPAVCRPAAIPIAGVAGDQQAALVAQGALTRAIEEYLRNRRVPAAAHWGPPPNPAMRAVCSRR